MAYFGIHAVPRGLFARNIKAKKLSLLDIEEGLGKFKRDTSAMNWVLQWAQKIIH
jgi:hypothetical protein